MGHIGRVGRRGRWGSAECTGRTSGSALTGERRGPATSSGCGAGRSRPRRPGGGSDRAGQRRARSGVVGRTRGPVSSLNLPPAGQPGPGGPESSPLPALSCLPQAAGGRACPRGEPIVVGEGDAVEECLVEGPPSATRVLAREAVGDGNSDLKGLAVLTRARAARVPVSVRPSMQAWGESPRQVLPARWRGLRAGRDPSRRPLGPPASLGGGCRGPRGTGRRPARASVGAAGRACAHTAAGGALGADGDEVGVRCAAPCRPQSPRRGPPHPDAPRTARGHTWLCPSSGRAACPSEAEEQAGTCLPPCASGPLRVGSWAEAPSVPGSRPPVVESTRPSRSEVLLRPWGLSRSERRPSAVVSRVQRLPVPARPPPFSAAFR